MMVLADYTDRANWVIGEFLIKEIKKPNIPVNLFIPGDPSKEPILMNGPITQKSYIDNINKTGSGAK